MKVSEGFVWFILFVVLLAAIAYWIATGMGVVVGLLVAIFAGALVISYARRPSS